MSLNVKFYGTRGSIPVSGIEYQEFGGNTTCIRLMAPETKRIGIIDAGTGIRELGRELAAIGYRQKEMFITFTHFHWDHIQGFPFFAPAYDPSLVLDILVMGPREGVDDLRDIFDAQLQEKFFPVQLDNMGARFEFLYFDERKRTFTPPDGIDVEVTAVKHRHPGGAYSYRFERGDSSLAVCTDIEHGDAIDRNVVELCKGVDLLIHEAQYTKEELKQKRGWGHSSYDQAMLTAEMAGAKQLVITHHDPDHDDAFLLEMEAMCRERLPNCVFARDRMSFEL
jgi:phosphoribosyl 1,2-cyclic phosphodiesterase